MALMSSDNKIKDILIDSKVISIPKITEAEKTAIKQNKRLEDVLVGMGLISSKKFNEIKSQVFNLPSVEIGEFLIDHKVLNLLNRKVSKNYHVIIFDRKGNQIKVGMVDPSDFQAHEAIDFLATQKGFEPSYFVISLEDFNSAYDQYSDTEKEIGNAFESAKLKFSQKEKRIKNYHSDDELEEVIKTAPVAKIVSVIIRNAMEGGASDIHIEPGRNGGRVRYRVDGILSSSLDLPSYIYDAVVSRIKVMANMKLDETRLPQDGRIRFTLVDKEVDLRVSVLPTLNQEKVVMRILDTSAGVPTLAELGFSENHIDLIERNMKKPYGMFLLTGPTGSGKTTTLYSILNILNSNEYNITTLEDPVEYYVDGVNQSQINPDIGYSFATGLRAILRQDPNIVMVGEIRDTETVELTIHAGLTGHLVFSTLHTNNAWGSISRLIDMKAEPFLLSSTLNLVMAQRLVRKICPHCKVEDKLTPKVEQKIKAEIGKMPIELLKEFGTKIKFYRGQGCKNCGNMGYVSRTVVAEILEVTPGLKDLITKEDFSQDKVDEVLRKQNHITLVQDSIIKALKGITSIDEILRVSLDQ